MRVGVVQMRSTDDLDANLDAAEALVREAASLGARWVALPENFAYLRREGTPFPCAQPIDGPIIERVAGWAEALGVWILAGSFPEQTASGDRVHNTSVLLSDGGHVVASYRKIHLFDVDLSAQGGGRFEESRTIAPGDEVVVAKTPFGGVGLSICYDLRFPELYRQQGVDRELRFLCVPAAFARETGRDHWEVLLRARAIENQCFVIAPAQWGQHTPDRASHGRAMAIDPWGTVLATAPDRPCVLMVDCDLEQQDRVRESLPALRHRRLPS